MATSVQLNHAGASPSPRCVLDRVVKHMELEQQVGGYQAAAMAKEELKQVYHHIGRLIHCSSPSEEIALVESATVGWTRLFYSMATYQDQHLRLTSSDVKKVILISQIEYAANVVACCHGVQQQLCKQSQWTIQYIPSVIDNNNRNTGVVDVTVLEEMLQGRFMQPNGSILDPSSIALVCITQIPTNSGVVNPVEAIGNAIANYNKKQRQQDSSTSPSMPQILYLVDACQSVGQMPIHVVTMQCHGLAATGRKYLRGPRGTGFLFASREIVNHLVPHQVDHASAPLTIPTQNDCNDCAAAVRTVPVEQLLGFSYQPGAARFEFWESNIANKLGLGRAVQYAIDDVGMETIQSKIQTLVSELQHRLQNLHSRLKVHHPMRFNANENTTDQMTDTCGIVTFWIENESAYVVQQALLACSPAFVTSVSPPTSTPLDSASIRVPDLVRVSLSYTNTEEDIEAFCQQLQIIIENGSSGS